MPSMDVFAILGAALAVMLVAILFLLPSEKNVRRSFKKREDKPAEPDKDWKAACLKMEKHIHAMRQEIEQGKGREKSLEHEILIQKEKTKKIQEKISQERGWQQREVADTEKKAKEIAKLKESLHHAQEEQQNEHAQFLRLEREIKETKDALTAALGTKRGLETQIAKLEAQVDGQRKDLAELREQNAKLSRQHDETTWVAKSEYDKLEQQLRKAEQEFVKFKSQVKRENV